MENMMQSVTSLKSTVIAVILKGSNYTLWSRTIKTSICGKGLWRHILEERSVDDEEDTGEGKEDEETKKENAKWFQEDQLVLGFLQNSLEPSILEAYSYCETAKTLWDTLKRVYGDVSNLSRIYEIKKAISELNQNDLDFKRYLGKFQSLWSELDVLRPSSIDPKVLNERREQDKIFGLLLNLNSSFNDVIKSILRESKLPNFEEVCSRVQKEEGSIGLFGGRKELATANKGIVKQEGKRLITCDHCHKKGHSKEKCWFLHPHLKPATFKDYKEPKTANVAQGKDEAETSNQGSELALHASMEYVKKSDLEALIKAYASKLGTSYLTSNLNANMDHKLVVDSGASHHMIRNAKLLENLDHKNVGKVKIADGNGIPIEGIGKLNLFNKKSDAFYIPKFKSNLVSVKRATNDLNCNVIFGPNDVKFQDIENGKTLGKGGTEDDLYVLNNALSINSDFSALKSCLSSNKSVLWHARLGHPHFRALNLILPDVSFDHSKCEACILGKHCRIVFPKSSTIYEHCFDLVHSDVWTSPFMSRDRNKYFVTFIDEKSKYTWVTLLPSKDKVYEAFVNFHNYVTNQFNAKIKVFRSDNGGEYTSQRFKDHLNKYGILHQTSCPHTPQQNGVAERKNRHLMDVARAMMFQTNVPKRFWGDAVLASCYLINRIPTRVLQDSSPFEVLNRTKPSINHLRVFGCVCFVYVPGEQRNKLEAKSIRCMFLGYSTTQKGYKCHDPSTNKTFVSRDVRFIEDQGYYDKKEREDLEELVRPSDLANSLWFLLNHLGKEKFKDSRQRDTPTNQDGNGDIQEEKQNEATQESPQDQEEEPLTTQESPQTQEEEPLQDSSQEGLVNHEGQIQEEEEGTVEEVEAEPVPPLRRSTRRRFGPENYKSPNTRVYYNSQAVAHPIQSVCSIDLLPEAHQAFLVKIEENQIPQSYEEAKNKKVWVDAIGDERGAMERNHTWDVEDLPKGKKAVTSKWVFTIKYKSNGDIERYKARLVARGFSQTYGEDYKETFAPVAKLNTVRVVLSLATNLSWDLWQMDVKNAFLQGDLKEEVYMVPPSGLEDLCKPGQALRLRKAIYGLKQSPRAWYHKLSSTLMDNGFKRSHSDNTLFTLKTSKGLVVILVYVDDLIVSGDDQEGIQEAKRLLKKAFDIKDLGELKYFLGLEVYRSNDGLFLSQRKYALDLLEETGKLGSKAAKTPLEDGYKVNGKEEKDKEKFADAGKYRRLVGKLIYLTLTRPDLCFAVNQVSQHMKEPTVYHWSMIERILRYIKGSPGQGIWMGKNGNTEIVGYCDSDWAGDRMDRKSTTGFCTFIGGNLVTWKTKKQKVVSCSSAEAEYRAMRKLTNELTWLKTILEDFGIKHDHPITMHCDNQAAIHIANNSVFHERTKHIEIDCHKVREKIEEGVIIPCYTRSEDQLADIFTKAASIKVSTHICGKLGLVDLTLP